MQSLGLANSQIWPTGYGLANPGHNHQTLSATSPQHIEKCGVVLKIGKKKALHIQLCLFLINFRIKNISKISVNIIYLEIGFKQKTVEDSVGKGRKF